jgi:hypothetical protein
MPSLHALPRTWLSFELPGYRRSGHLFATYTTYAHEGLPPIEESLDDELRWLLDRPAVPPPTLADANEGLPRPTIDDLRRVAGEIDLPPSFAAFFASPEPGTRIRSRNDCYLDVGDFALPVTGGGTLVHFLADPQGVLRWLVYVGPDGSESVVVTDIPLCFDLGDDDLRVFDPRTTRAFVCADSFSEFLYRFWIENEIWFRLAGPDANRTLTEEQLWYAEHYATS